MWVLTNDGETAVNLEHCHRLTIEHKEGRERVIAWNPQRGMYVYEGTRERCIEWINSMTARMNGKML